MPGAERRRPGPGPDPGSLPVPRLPPGRVPGATSDSRRPHLESGYVTAETAVVIPALVLLLGMLLWGVAAAVGHLQCVDGARTGARAAARGEQAPAVRTAVRAVAPDGATVVTGREGRLVRVQVRARTAGPGPLTAELHAEAVAFAEARPTDDRAARARPAEARAAKARAAEAWSAEKRPVQARPAHRRPVERPPVNRPSSEGRRHVPE